MMHGHVNAANDEYALLCSTSMSVYYHDLVHPIFRCWHRLALLPAHLPKVPTIQPAVAEMNLVNG